MDLREGDPCPFCAAEFEAEIYDYSIEERWFLFSTCCEDSYREFSYQVCLWDRKRFLDWLMSQIGVKVRGCWIEDLGDSHLPAVLDYGLELKPISLVDVNAFVEKHHRHNGKVNAFKAAAGIWNGPDLIGVVTVEPPRARMLKDRKTTLEVTRVCVREDIEPRELVANACSMAYGFAARETRRLGYRKVITYTRIDEKGGSVKSAGFTPVYQQRNSGTWGRQNRPRLNPKSPPVPKVRWERMVA